MKNLHIDVTVTKPGLTAEDMTHLAGMLKEMAAITGWNWLAGGVHPCEGVECEVCARRHREAQSDE